MDAERSSTGPFPAGEHASKDGGPEPRSRTPAGETISAGREIVMLRNGRPRPVNGWGDRFPNGFAPVSQDHLTPRQNFWCRRGFRCKVVNREPRLL